MKSPTRWSRCGALAVLILNVPIASAQGTTPLVPIPLSDWNLRCGTYRADDVEARFTRDNQVRRSSEFSLHIENLGAPPGTALYRTAAVPACDGCTYSASAWVKRRQASAAIAIRFLNDQEVYIDGPQQSTVLEGDGDWQELAVSAVAPAGTAALHVFLICRQGQSWFDDLSLRDDLAVRFQERLAQVNVHDYHARSCTSRAWTMRSSPIAIAAAVSV